MQTRKLHRGRMISVGAIVVAILLTSPASALAGRHVTPVVVTERRSEEWASAAGGYLAYNHRRPGFDNEESMVLLEAPGLSAVRVNPSGTYANYPTLDLANANLGDVLVVSQWRGSGDHDLVAYDVASGDAVDLPSDIDTNKTEMRPSLSGDFLFFGRGPVGDPPNTAILYDLSSGTSTTVDTASYVWPGDVEGDWPSTRRASDDVGCGGIRSER